MKAEHDRIEKDKRVHEIYKETPLNQVLTTLPAHYDGKQVQLDVDYPLKSNTVLLVPYPFYG